jgi:hypothetical protein
LLAGFFGVVALSLVLASILTMWLNRTLLDTNTYVNTVAPLASNPDVQEFVVTKVVDAVQKGAQDQANQAGQAAGAPADSGLPMFVSPAEAAGKTPEQLQTLARHKLSFSLDQIVKSPRFQELWTSTNRSAHTTLVGEVKSNDKDLTLDLAPVLRGVIDQLKTTDLAPVAADIQLPADAGTVKLQGGAIEQVRKVYNGLQTATVVMLLVMLVSAALAVVLSVQHIRTMRRILMGTGIIALLLAGVLYVPQFVSFGSSDPQAAKVAAVVFGILTHDLRLAALLTGIGCVVLALATKVYSVLQARRPRAAATR